MPSARIQKRSFAWGGAALTAAVVTALFLGPLRPRGAVLSLTLTQGVQMSGTEPEVVVDHSISSPQAKLLLDGADYPRYAVELRQAELWESAWQAKDVKPDGGALTVEIPGRVVGPGRYVLVLTGRTLGDDGREVPAGRYSFRVQRP